MSEETFGPCTDAYDEIVARFEAREVLGQEDDLLEVLTGPDEPSADELPATSRGVLTVVAAIFLLMTVVGILASPIAGFTLAGILALLFCIMVEGAKELSATKGGAGDMFRNRRVGRSLAAQEQAQERREVIDEISKHENPYTLLENLDDPEYMRTLKAALQRDEEGWIMSE
jgi:hypothetical protein